VDQRVGIAQHDNSQEKIIKCSNCGQSYRVPGYVIDYNCQCKRKVTELDASKLTDRMANMQRDYIIKTEARDSVIPAIAHSPEMNTNRKQVV
jgi:hypothetical protein